MGECAPGKSENRPNQKKTLFDFELFWFGFRLDNSQMPCGYLGLEPNRNRQFF